MEPISLYIHIPFCVRKCLYCDFPSFASDTSLYAPYIKVLEHELLSKSKILSGHTVKTVYFGGGTPTLLPPQLIGKLLNVIYTKFNVSADCEITAEANPGALGKDSARAFFSMGINRLSIGLQAWQDAVLRTLGRIHTKDDFLRSYDAARTAGFRNINIDLMFSVPGQKTAWWEETLINAVRAKPEHLSCYSLIFEEGTPFMSLKRSGFFTETPEDQDREMYYLAEDVLSDAGFERYEISNFARPGKECRHNLTYWLCGEYMGAGLASHSYFQGHRFSNITGLEEYAASEGNLEIIEASREKLTLRDRYAEFMFLGLRLKKGVSNERFRNVFGVGMRDVYGQAIDALVKNNLLSERDGYVFLTPRGTDISNYVFEKFLL